MCGIFGILKLDGTEADLEVAVKGARHLAHRGPDGEGSFHEDVIALTHTRLAIQDLSSSAVQPMQSHSGRYILSYNGEIYNTKAILDSLQIAGKHMQTASDTEMFLEAWDEWGADSLLKIDGMFAAAIWDRKKKALTLIRDPIGIKPLFIYHSKNALYFSSEVQALLKAAPIEKRLNYQSLTDMLFLGSDVDPTTSIAGIDALKPGHYLTVDMNGRSHENNYWSPTLIQQRESCTEAFEDILEANLALSMTSDVPVDILLSGGIDSNALAAALKQKDIPAQRAHIMQLSGRNYDESNIASRSANYFNLPSQVCDTNGIDLVDLSDQVLTHSGEITPNPSFIATWHLLKNVAPTKVVLSGDGPDELLFGYDTYDASYMANRLGILGGQKIWHYLERIISNIETNFDRRSTFDSLSRFLYGFGFNQYSRHGIWRCLMSAYDARQLLLSPELANEIANAKPAEHSYGQLFSLMNNGSAINKVTDPLKQMSYADLSIYLPNDGLVKMDRVGMAHGVEVRVPYLNKSFVEYCLNLPTQFSYRPFKQRKSPLKHYLQKYGHPDLLQVKKRGFNVPIGDWMLKEKMTEYCDHWLSNETCKKYGLFQGKNVNYYWQQHKRLKQNHANKLWPIIATHRFLDHYNVNS